MRELNIDQAKKIIQDETSSSVFSNNQVLDTEAKVQEFRDDEIRAKIAAKEKKEIIAMRRQWSKWLLIAVIAIVIFDFLVVLLVGLGWMEFAADFVLPIFIADSLIKTIGLALIVVKFLFNEKSL